MDWKSLFLSADGRIGKKEFWIGWVILFAASIVLGMIPLIGQIASIALIYPSVCVFSKRLHDFGKSGWLAAVPYVVGLVGTIVAFMIGGAGIFAAAMSGQGGDDPAAAAAAMSGMGGALAIFGLIFLFYIAYTLWVGLSSGDPGENRYGPAPADGQVGAPVL